MNIELKEVSIEACKDFGRMLQRNNGKTNIHNASYNAALELIKAHVDTVVDPVFSNMTAYSRECKKYTRAINNGYIDEALSGFEFDC